MSSLLQPLLLTPIKSTAFEFGVVKVAPHGTPTESVWGMTDPAQRLFALFLAAFSGYFLQRTSWDWFGEPKEQFTLCPLYVLFKAR